MVMQPWASNLNPCREREGGERGGEDKWGESFRHQDTLLAGGEEAEGGLLACNMELACLQHGAEGEQA